MVFFFAICNNRPVRVICCAGNYSVQARGCSNRDPSVGSDRLALDEVFEGLTIASLPCSEVPLYLRPNINFYFLNIFLHNRRQFSVEVLMINGILVYVSVCLWAAEL